MGDTIVLAKGTYLWSDQAPAVPAMLWIRRGVTLKGAEGPEVTILDAQGSGRLIVCQGAGNRVRIEGLTLQNGFATGTGQPLNLLEHGGAVHADGASHPTLVKCIVRDNRSVGDCHHAGGWGGGIACSNATLIGCRFIDNQACSGGGVGCSQLLRATGCVFEGNRAFSENGGGIYAKRAELRDCSFVGNVSGGRYAFGGGASIRDGSVDRCTFVGNEVRAADTASGGGLEVSGTC